MESTNKVRNPVAFIDLLKEKKASCGQKTYLDTYLRGNEVGSSRSINTWCPSATVHLLKCPHGSPPKLGVCPTASVIQQIGNQQSLLTNSKHTPN